MIIYLLLLQVTTIVFYFLSVPYIIEIENNLFDCYEVYDFKGLKIKTCSSKDELKNLKGFFVVKCYSQGIYLKTIKLSRL